MNDVLNQILSQVGPQGLQAISNQLGTNENETKTALEGVIPTLLGAMASNTQTKQGAQGLLGALDSDHDGSILDDVVGFVGNFQDGPGQGILKHVLGGQQPTVENKLSNKTNMNSSQISSLLKIAAPLVLGYLGRQKRQSNSSGFNIGDIAQLLGGMTQQADQSTGLDIGDVLSVVGSLTGDQKGGGAKSAIGLLGKLFRR